MEMVEGKRWGEGREKKASVRKELARGRGRGRGRRGGRWLLLLVVARGTRAALLLSTVVIARPREPALLLSGAHQLAPCIHSSSAG